MSSPMITYDSASGELRNNPDAFAEKDDYVASIVWETKVGDDVVEGDNLGTIQWGEGSKESLVAPKECNGTVHTVNRDIIYEKLEYPPSQLFALIS